MLAHQARKQKAKSFILLLEEDGVLICFWEQVGVPISSQLGTLTLRLTTLRSFLLSTIKDRV